MPVCVLLMQKIVKLYGVVVANILNTHRPKTVLDAPSGSGWLRTVLDYDVVVDGIDLYEEVPDGYRSVRVFDLDDGLPGELPQYEAIVTCEGIEHIANPGLFLKDIKAHLVDGGLMILTTPNIWYPQSRLQFWLRGFFPGFPCLVGKINRGSHMHIMPWSYPQLYLYLRLFGFGDIVLHDEEQKKPKHFFEKIIGLPQYLYCKRKVKKSATEEERSFWKAAGSSQSVYGRHLIITATSRKS